MTKIDASSTEQRAILNDLSGGGGSAGEAEARSPRPRARIGTQNLIIAGVLAASAGLIYAMRQYGMGAGMTFSAPPVSYEPNKELARISETQAQVLAELAMGGPTGPSEKPIEKNPFRLDSAPSTLALPDGVASDDPALREAIEAEKARLARLEQLEDSLKTLSLSSILMGRVPLARVNEKMVRVGDTIESFRVAEIREQSILLEAEGNVYTLAIQTEDLR